MHVVFTVGTYYPLYSATSRCAKNLVDVMTTKHRVSVIALRRWDSPKDTTEVGLRERLIYVDTSINSVRAKVNCCAKKGGLSKGWHYIDRFFAALRYSEIFFSKTACHWSEVNAYLRALESLGENPDHLIPVSLPFEGVVACALYKKKHPEVVLTPLIFDQFSESSTLLKTEHERRKKFKGCLELERMIAEASDRVFTVTWDEHVRAYLPELADKFQHIEHPMLVQDKIVEFGGTGIFGPGLHAVYAGALNMGIRDPRHLTGLFEGFSAREGNPIMLHAYAVGDGVSAVREAQARRPEDIKVHEPVAPHELPNIYASADVLVSVGNNTSNQKASKITEYMATGKPILHIACSNEDPAITDVEKYPLGLVLRTDDGIGLNQDKLSAFIKEVHGKRVPFDTVAALFNEEIPANVANLILQRGC